MERIQLLRHIFAPTELLEWLDGVRQGYGARFAAVLAAAGWEHPDDLCNSPPSAAELAAALAPAKPKRAQLELIANAFGGVTTGAAPAPQTSAASPHRRMRRTSSVSAAADASTTPAWHQSRLAPATAMPASAPPSSLKGGTTHGNDSGWGDSMVSPAGSSTPNPSATASTAASATAGARAKTLPTGAGSAGGNPPPASKKPAGAEQQQLHPPKSRRMSLPDRQHSPSRSSAASSSSNGGTSTSTAARADAERVAAGGRAAGVKRSGKKGDNGKSAAADAAAGKVASSTNAGERGSPVRGAVRGARTQGSALTAGEMQKTLHGEKHAMLSYQWDHQTEVLRARKLLGERGVKCWMDVDNMAVDIYDSMAAGVQGAGVVVCFMSQKYQDSPNCKLELKFAQQSGMYVYGAVREGGAVQSTTLPKSILTSMQEVCIHINTDVLAIVMTPPRCAHDGRSRDAVFAVQAHRSVHDGG